MWTPKPGKMGSKLLLKAAAEKEEDYIGVKSWMRE